MSQKGDNSNFVRFRDVGDNNTFHFVQNANVTSIPSYVKLVVDQDSVQKYPKAELEKGAVRGGIVLVGGSGAATFIPSLADWLGILGFLGLNNVSPMTITIVIAIVLLTFSEKFEKQNLTSFAYWLASVFIKRNEVKLVGPGSFLKVDNEGNRLTYKISAPCISPECSGKIIVKKLPPRESHRDGYADICSLAYTAHSYHIDYNGTAVPKDLDWRLPDQPPNYYNPSYRR